MSIRARPVLLVASACALILGCGDSSPTEPTPPSLTGSWSGTVQATGQSYAMTLTQAGTRVTGTGTVVDVDGSASTAIVGTTQGFNVELTISYPNTGYNPVVFTGSFATRDELRGELKFSSLPVPDPITFRRQ